MSATIKAPAETLAELGGEVTLDEIRGLRVQLDLLSRRLQAHGEGRIPCPAGDWYFVAMLEDEVDAVLDRCSDALDAEREDSDEEPMLRGLTLAEHEAMEGGAV